ncbi:hypothetical protein ACIBF5_29710 [Micromonospora sp. NPDC050417]|uniref:hypothetical protein n=1 Tax=Micromonospora sp. NPDC050417 TaxID=3364280 RepID=UPI0037A53329
MTQPLDANSLLMSRGVKSIGWQENPVGYTVVGTIVDQPKVEQMKKHDSDELDFWPSGDPKMQIITTLQTTMRDPANPHDDGQRRLHIPPRMMTPVREAILRAGATGLAIGGQLAVRRTGGTGLKGSPFEFAAEYAPPAVDPGSLLGGTTTQPAAAAPVSAAAQSLGLTSPAAPVDDTPPPGIDPAKWAALPAEQRAAVRAAMGQPNF